MLTCSPAGGPLPPGPSVSRHPGTRKQTQDWTSAGEINSLKTLVIPLERVLTTIYFVFNFSYHGILTILHGMG